MFKVTSSDGLARCGGLVLSKTAAPISTPAPMLYTRRGSSIFLTPDMLQKLQPEAQLVQINALQFLDQPGPDVLRHFGRSIHHYLGLSNWPVFASNRDPTLTEYLGTKPSSNKHAYVTIHSGAMTVPPEKYMEAIRLLQPDMFVALADEVAGDATAKRIALSVNRTTQWLDDCIRLKQEAQQQQQQQPEQQQQQQHNGHTSEPQEQQKQQQQPDHTAAAAAAAAAGQQLSALFAPVVGGASESERQRSAKAAAERDVAGFALCGFGMGEHFSARPKLLSAALQHLPDHKPRVAVGLDSPEDILMAVSQGVDLFDSSYPMQATACGYALSFPLTPEAAAQQQQQDVPSPAAAAAPSNPFGTATSSVDEVGADAGADDSKINLWAVQHRLDKGPLVQGCSCFTCRNHSRAYIHHLLLTHEMLAGVLLEMHNTHWWLGFFGAVREAVQQGRLQQYMEWFMQRRAVQQQQEWQQPQQAAHGSWAKHT